MAQKKTTDARLVREFSAGGVVYRRVKERESGRVEVYWLIIRPAGTKRWQLPKGHIEEKESAQETAVREVFEETSVRARVIDKIGITSYFYVLNGKRIVKRVTFFLMEYEGGVARVHEDWQREIEKVLWASTKRAFRLLTFKDDKEIIRKAEKRLEQGVQVNMI